MQFGTYFTGAATALAPFLLKRKQGTLLAKPRQRF